MKVTYIRLVIKIGGSLVFDDMGPRIDYLKKLIPVIKKIKSRHNVIITIGGGRFVKKYAKRLKYFLNKNDIDAVNVELLRANVMMMAHLMKMKPIFNISEIRLNGIIGGIAPGRSTDTNAVICAEKIGAMLIKLTNVDGVYDKDPKKYKNAKKIDFIPFKDIDKIQTGGDYKLLDPLAMKLIKNHKIKTIIMSGKNPENIFKAIEGKNIGTRIG
ncbi:MAG: hypothetical protein V1802_02545 [Candidatus Aenigmatarchaeota archaeon]